ncbi:MAG: hypothetical protein JWO59_249, partial [Chloroflexi bacterium]|nr:hypothetical protein [Chloroflexota bacterium]
MYNGAYIAKGERWGDRSRMQLAAYALTDRGRRRSQN